jgi:hypothetical protein
MTELESPSETRRQLEASMQNYSVNQELFETAAAQQAEMQKIQFDAYVKAGFTSAQALELVKHWSS